MQKMVNVLLSVLIVIGLVSVLIISQTGAEKLTGKGYSDLSSEQKQKYWDCFNSKCKSLLKEAQLSKNYIAYRDCSLNCNALAQAVSAVWCNDTDGGLDYFKKGTVFSNVYTNGKEDECKEYSSGKVYLKEGRCKNNKYGYMQKKCEEINSNYYCDLELDECKEKNNPTINALFIYWGDYYDEGIINNKISYYEDYFNAMTKGNVLLKIDYGGTFPIPEEDALHDYSTIAKQFNLGMEDAKKIWYYYHQTLINGEIEDLLKENNYKQKDYDIAIIYTDINSQYLGQIFKYYPFLVLKSFLYKDYETSSLKKEEISDEISSDTLTHELGHFMGLTHACVTTPCSDCAYPDDIMSYCREKGSPKNKFFSCSMDNIQSYSKLFPDGTMLPIDKYFKSCDELSQGSKCYGVKCNNYCDSKNNYFLGGKCDLSNGECKYNYQPSSPLCVGICTKVLTRTNIFDGVYSGIGIDDNAGWISVDLNPNSESLVAFGWNSFITKNISTAYKLIAFTWEGYPVKININNNNELIIDPPDEKKPYKYTLSSFNSKNAIIFKESVSQYSKLEFVSGCEPIIDFCSNTSCKEGCNPLNGECFQFNYCLDFCNYSTNTWFYESKFNLNIGSCEYQKNKEKVCGGEYEVISRTNVLGGVYNENGTTKDGGLPWIALNQGGKMIPLKYIETTFKLPWRTYTLVGYTWDNKPIEKEYYFGDYNKYLVDSKYLFENTAVDNAIITSTINSDYFSLEYHDIPNALQNKCKDVFCSDYCESEVLNYNGFCNYYSGKCDYKQKESIVCSSDCSNVLSRTNKKDGLYQKPTDTTDGMFPWVSLYNQSATNLFPLGWTPKVAIASTDRTDYELVGYTWDFKPIVIDPTDKTNYIINYEGWFTTTSPAKDNSVNSITSIPKFVTQEFYGLNCVNK